MTDLNCHFVSRFLTAPWEFGERQLYFYDVKTRTFGQKSSKNLFARPGLNTPETEGILNRLVETPLGKAIGNLTRSTGPDGCPMDDWSIYRAMVLLFPFQTARMVKSPKPGYDLSSLCAWSEEELNQLAWASQQRYKFITVRAHPGSRFFYPSKGYFIIPLAFTSSLRPGAIAIPLTERCAIASVPVEIKDEHLAELFAQGGGGLAINASVGTRFCEQIVIHPTVKDHASEDELRQYIESTQERNLTLLQDIFDLSHTTVAAFAEAGLGPEQALEWVGDFGSQIREEQRQAVEQSVGRTHEDPLVTGKDDATLGRRS
jgi:hypothetical protein